MRGRAGVRAVVTGPWGRPRCVGWVGMAGGRGGHRVLSSGLPVRSRLYAFMCAPPLDGLLRSWLLSVWWEELGLGMDGLGDGPPAALAL